MKTTPTRIAARCTIKHVRHGLWRSEAWTRIGGVVYIVRTTAAKEYEARTLAKVGLRNMVSPAVSHPLHIVWRQNP